MTYPAPAPPAGAIDVLLQGAAVDYPALLAHSAALEREHAEVSGAHHTHAHQS
ncbi:hypothetical protein [Nocardiopsis nanhaiensis]